MTSAAEVAAYIGAAAWLPPIILVIIGAVVKPRVTIVPERQIEIGYTTNGPILNLRLAVSTAKKNTIIDHVGMEIRHQDGDSYVFSWYGMRESVSQIKDLTGNMQFVEREYSPIALVLNKGGLTERFFRFQYPIFHKKHKDLVKIATDHQAYLKSKNANYHQEFLDSKEIHSVLDFYRDFFFWKAGKYYITFSISSPKSTLFTSPNYFFEIQPYELLDLKKNLGLFKFEAENIIKNEVENYEAKKFEWSWITTSLDKTEA